MLAPPRPALRGPEPRRRGLTRSSLVGVGLIALTASGVPAALADDEADLELDPVGPAADLESGAAAAARVLVEGEPQIEEQAPSSIEAYFGRGKSVDFQVEYDDSRAPAGLDLSGAVFTLTDGEEEFSCTTDVGGSCSVEAIRDPVLAGWFGMGPQVASNSHALVPAGSYTVTQTAAPVGLSIATGSGSVGLCGLFTECDGASFPPVVNDSQFRSPVVGAVLSTVDDAPVEGATYRLTGPAYVATPTDVVVVELPEDGSAAGAEAPAEEFADSSTEARIAGDPVESESEIADLDLAETDGPPRQTVTATSAADGSLTFLGWFVPGTDYTLTPVGAVPGFTTETEPATVTVAPSSGVLRAELAPRRLAPVSLPGTVGTGADTTPTPGPAPVPPPAAAAGSTPTAAPPAGTRSPSAGRVETAQEAVPSAAPVTGAARPSVAADRATGWTTSPRAAPVPVAAGPDLQTVGSSLPDKGVVLAIGVLFLAVALGGVALVRRHARRRA